MNTNTQKKIKLYFKDGRFCLVNINVSYKYGYGASGGKKIANKKSKNNRTKGDYNRKQRLIKMNILRKQSSKIE